MIGPSEVPCIVRHVYECIVCQRQLERETEVMAGEHPQQPARPRGWHFMALAVAPTGDDGEQMHQGLVCDRHELAVHADGQVIWQGGAPEPIGT